MTRYKRNFIFLKAAFVVLISTSIFAEEKNCQFYDLKYRMQVVGCSNEDGVSVIKLVPSGQASYETNLENIPTFIVSGGDLDKVLEAVGSEESRYNKLINLPYPEAILHYDDASIAAKSKLAGVGWKLLNMKDVVYEGHGGEEGAGLVCSTLERKIDLKYVAVSQCNSFYDSDVSDLKMVLDLLANHK